MSEKKISREVAEQELRRILDVFAVDPEGLSWEDSKKRLMSAIERGAIVLDENRCTITLALVAPIKLNSGDTIAEFTFREPTAADFKAIEKYKVGEDMSKTTHLASLITGQPIGVTDRMGSRDLQTMGAIVSLFS